MYLLDTDILSNLMKRAPASALVTRLARVRPEDQFTSECDPRGTPVRRASVEPHRRSTRAYRGNAPAELPILPFDAAAARRYGEIRAELERRGNPIGDADTRVASIALSGDLRW